MEGDGCMFPVRCWGCGKPQNYKSYLDLINEGLNPGEALDKMRLSRSCCRNQYITYNIRLERIVTSYDTKSKNGKIPNDWIGV